MRFFDEPAASPPPPPEPSYRLPEWIAAPENVIPATVALDVILARTERVAVWVADALVFPAGITVGLSVKRRPGSGDERGSAPFFEPSDEGGLRFGVQFADGRKAVAHGLQEMRPFLARPDRPILRPRSGGGGGGLFRSELWLWPLPPEGPITFVCAWPAEGVTEARGQADAAAIIAAASRAREMWPDDRPLPPSEDDVVI